MHCPQFLEALCFSDCWLVQLPWYGICLEEDCTRVYSGDETRIYIEREVSRIAYSSLCPCYSVRCEPRGLMHSMPVSAQLLHEKPSLPASRVLGSSQCHEP